MGRRRRPGAEQPVNCQTYQISSEERRTVCERSGALKIRHPRRITPSMMMPTTMISMLQHQGFDCFDATILELARRQLSHCDTMQSQDTVRTESAKEEPGHSIFSVYTSERLNMCMGSDKFVPTKPLKLKVTVTMRVTVLVVALPFLLSCASYHSIVLLDCGHPQMSEVLHRPYEGLSRRLVASVDIGTTFSAASFCILKPGNVPKFDEILSWPNQAVADGKVASVIYYDESGKPRAYGAETEDEEINLEAEDNGWYKAEWWKLGLRPEHLPLIKGLQLPALPPIVSIDQIFADFFSFVKFQIMLYISRSYADGANIWETLEPSMYFILTTPNGWEGVQQDRMRKAAIKGGLVDQNDGRRIKFVTEAEAALLYAANTGNVDDWLSEGGNVILCDCGGGTIDITGYSITQISPLRLVESSAAQCYLAGGVHVSNEAKAYFQRKLAGSEWGNEDSIRRIADNFERNAKKKFNDAERVSYVQLDGHGSDSSLGIVRGRLKVPGNVMAAFFQPSIDAIIEGLRQAFENGGRVADKIILVGGLASSPYVYSKVSEWGERFGISISSPDGPTTKAVASGALAWHLDNNISARIARYHYGIEVREPYDKQNPEMACRVAVLDQYVGRQMVDGGWACIVEKGQRIENKREFQGSYNIPRGLFSPKQFTVEILVYRRSKPPRFVTVPSTGLRYPGFETLCSVNVDLQGIWDSTQYWRMSPITGERYKTLEFNIHIALGETEVTARSSWVVKGVTRYGAAAVAFD